jgi:hypothetical protein
MVSASAISGLSDLCMEEQMKVPVANVKNCPQYDRKQLRPQIILLIFTMI